MKDKRGRRYVLSEEATGKMLKVYLKKCKNCKIYKIPASAKRDLCFRCEGKKEFKDCVEEVRKRRQKEK